MFSLRLSVVAIAIMLLSSLAYAEDIGPFRYKCDDGRSFTITFVKAEGESSPMTARLALPKSKDVVILTNQGGASGIHYANDRYTYDEWHGNVSFRDSSKKVKGKTTQGVSCHEVKK
ncbi:MAG: MliC family protein [Syntrophorhabdaceae bacterium]|nr:MliC family protein [Syntrophorhabdaceae bacterium]